MAGPLQFGQRIAGIRYQDRPGAYGLALGTNGLLVVSVGELFALPGGGLEADESFEEALVREYREETGYQVRIRTDLGIAHQYVHSANEQAYYNKICRFYRVELVGARQSAEDKDHAVHLLPVGDALGKLSEEAHRWAVTQAVGP